MDVREKLVELLAPTSINFEKAVYLADYLIANGVTVQEWISVKDRLPEQNKDVLVYTITHDVRKAHCYGERSWFGHDGIWRCVTHWMPLPQPPKGE